MRFRVRRLFQTCSINFVAQFLVGRTVEKYLLNAIEHQTEWPIARAIKYVTSDDLLKLMEEETVFCSQPPKKIISDNRRFSHVKNVEGFMQENNITWKKAMDCAPISNERTERFAGSIKRLVVKTMFQGQKVWATTISYVLYGYPEKPRIVNIPYFS